MEASKSTSGSGLCRTARAVPVRQLLEGDDDEVKLGTCLLGMSVSRSRSRSRSMMKSLAPSPGAPPPPIPLHTPTELTLDRVKELETSRRTFSVK